MIEKVISELIPSALAHLAFLEFVFPKVAERAFDHVLNRRMAEFKWGCVFTNGNWPSLH